MSVNDPVGKLLTTKQAVEYLGSYSVRTLEDWRLNRVGPAYVKHERTVRYRPSDLDAFLNEHTVGNRASASVALTVAQAAAALGVPFTVLEALAAVSRGEDASATHKTTGAI